MREYFSFYFFAILVFLSLAGPVTAQITYNQIAISGELAPETLDSAVFGGFSNPVLNDSGQVAFFSFLETGSGAAVTSDNDQALFAPNSTLELGMVAREGDIAPGVADGALYSGFLGTAPNVNNNGDVAFKAILKTGAGTIVDGDNDAAIFGPNGGLTLIARESLPAPGATDNAVFGEIDDFAINDVGDVLLTAQLETGNGPAVTDANSIALLGPTSGAGSAMGVIARRGDSAPGVADGAAYLGFGTANKINNLGDVVFYNNLQTGTGAEVTDDNSNAIFGPTISGLSLLGREDTPAPGVLDGAEFKSFSTTSPDLNNAGDVAFVGFLRTGTGAAVDNTFGPDDNSNAVFGPTAGSGSPIGVIARANDPAPGTADCSEFSSFSGPQVNDAGDVLVSVSLRTGTGDPVNEGFSGPDTNDIALFGPTAGPGSPFGQIVRRDDTAPNVTDGAEFNFFGDVVLNNAGDVAFTSVLRQGNGGDPLDSTNDRGLFAYSGGESHLIAREGDLFSVLHADGVTEEQRTISFIDFGPGALNGTQSLNNAGELVFKLTFTDGSSGVFVATLPSAVLEGDYNDDGTVDLADYTLWRNNLGAVEGSLKNTAVSGIIGDAHYSEWKTNYGSTTGTAITSKVPEPSSLAIVIMLGVIALAGSEFLSSFRILRVHIAQL